MKVAEIAKLTKKIRPGLVGKLVGKSGWLYVAHGRLLATARGRLLAAVGKPTFALSLLGKPSVGERK